MFEFRTVERSLIFLMLSNFRSCGGGGEEAEEVTAGEDATGAVTDDEASASAKPSSGCELSVKSLPLQIHKFHQLLSTYAHFHEGS